MRKLRLILVTASVAALMASLAAPALALMPPGNNGTIKIDGRPFDEAPDNEPHVNCGLQVDFYGFEMGDYTATLTFELIAPTAGGTDFVTSVFVGEDAAGGGTDLDAQKTVNLRGWLANSGVTPHPIQGYHVKLTTNTPFSLGADVKHKVFWIQGCAS